MQSDDRKSADAALLKALKSSLVMKSPSDQEKAKRLIALVRPVVADCEEYLRIVTDYFLKRRRMAEIGQPMNAPISSLLSLGEAGFLKSAEYGLEQCKAELKTYPLANFLDRAPTARSVDFLAQLRKGLAAEILVHLKGADPSVAARSAALDWSVKKAKGKDGLDLFPIVLAISQRPAHLISASDLLKSIVERDKKGLVLLVLVDRCETRRVEDILSESRLAAITFVALLPKLLTGSNAANIAQLFSEWIATSRQWPIEMRQKLSGPFLTLCGQLLSKPKRTESMESVLDNVSKFGHRSFQSKEHAAGIWVTLKVNDSNTAQTSDLGVSELTAKLIAASIEKAAQGYQATALFEALALNSGMQSFGAAGEEVFFDPDKHQDIKGGLRRGDPVTIQLPGWRLGEVVVLKVKTQTSSHE
jgi:hypothetical protein